jgi:hypothetical protein
LSGEIKDLAELIKKLNSNIEILSKVTSLTFRKESLFKFTETTPEKIQILDDLRLPDEIIAIIIGSTVGSVRAQRSQAKSKTKKTQQAEPEKKIDDEKK